MTSTYETLTGLVERFSPSGNEEEAVAWLVGRMLRLGFASAWADEAGNAVGTIGEGPSQIVLLGHIDTVPGKIPVRVENGILHGRGAVDAKGPLAAFVDAAAQTGPVPGWQIVVIGAVDEEGDSAGAWHVASRYHPRYAILGEPSGWNRIALGYRGVVHFRFQAQHTIGHSAAGQDSVCEAAVEFWNRLVEICARENKVAERKFDQLTPVLQEMHSAGDGFIETGEMAGNVRLPQRVASERMKQMLGEAAEGIGTVETDGIPLNAFRVEKSTPVVGALLSGIRSLGGDPSFSLKLGTSDLSIVGPAWNCPMAIYGPGDSTLDHTPGECISLEEYGKAAAVLVGVLKRLTAAVR
ncbi:MAG TPA: [LysW]-lysine hydrolase [Anaerolineales bacterium]